MKDSRLFRRFAVLALGLTLTAVPLSASAQAADDVHTYHNVSTLEASAAEQSFAGGAFLTSDKVRVWDEEQLVVTVRAYSTEEANAHDLVVIYDSAALELAAVRAADPSRTYIVDASKSVPGEARIITAGSPFSGDAELVELVFTSQASAVSEIRMSKAEAARTVDGISEMGPMVLPSASLDIISLSLDINNDGSVTAADLDQLGTGYRQRAVDDTARFDLNGDGIVDALDMTILMNGVS